MSKQGPIPLLKSTFEAIQERIAEIERKLTTEMPKTLQESYETGGGWHDNALWETALRDQGMLNRELRTLLSALRDIVFIEDLWILLDEDKVTVGKTIQVENISTGEISEYSIVGPLDVIYSPHSKEGKFASHNSPFTQPLIGKLIGEMATVKSPRGHETLLIKEIRPLSFWEAN